MTSSATTMRPLAWSVSAGLSAQVMQAALAVVVMPIYLRLLGDEAFGVVGFYLTVQAWFAVADVGLSATLSRESARMKAGSVSGEDFRVLLRTFEVLFVLIALSAAALVWALRAQLAEHWLNGESLLVAEIARAVGVIGLVAALRTIGGLYRSILIGSEQIVLASALLVLFAALRYAGVIVWMAVTSVDLVQFFTFQIGAALAELVALCLFAYKWLPPGRGLVLPSIAAGRAAVPFAASIASVSVIWIAVTQLDKLIVSRVVSLAEFGHFTLAVTAAGVIAMIYGPVGQALMPRLTSLVAAGQHSSAERVYETATKGVSVLVFPVAFTFACFATELVFAWTGNIRLAVSVAPVVVGYSIGNAILAVAAFGYYLQFAHGVLRLHVAGMLLFLGVLTTMLIPLVGRFGMTGAAAAWLLVNLAYLLAWMPVVHSRYLPKKSAAWLLRDVLPAAAAAGLVALLFAAMLDGPATRLQGLWHAVAAGVASLVAAAFAAFAPQAVTRLTQRSR